MLPASISAGRGALFWEAISDEGVTRLRANSVARCANTVLTRQPEEQVMLKLYETCLRYAGPLDGKESESPTRLPPRSLPTTEAARTARELAVSVTGITHGSGVHTGR